MISCKRCIFLLTLFALISTALHSQNKSIDSLKNLVSKARKDSELVNSYVRLSEKLKKQGLFAEAKSASAKALDLANEISWKKGTGKSYQAIGMVHMTLRDYDSAIVLFGKAIKAYEDIELMREVAECLYWQALACNNNQENSRALNLLFRSLEIRKSLGLKKDMDVTYSRIGTVYYDLSDFPACLKNYTEALKIREEMHDTARMVPLLCNIGNVYLGMKNPGKGLEYYKTAQRLYSEKNANLNTLSNIYNNTGVAYYDKKEYDSSTRYFNLSMQVSQSSRDTDNIGTCLLNLANICTRKQDYSGAAGKYKEALFFYERSGNKLNIATLYQNMGEMYYEARQYDKSRDLFNRIASMQKDIESPEIISKLHLNMARLNFATGRYKEAYLDQVEFQKLNDSIFNVENSKQMGDIKTQFEVEKKEIELRARSEAEKEKLELKAGIENRRQRQLLYSVLAGLLLVIVFSVFILRALSQNQKANKIITSQKDQVEQQKKLVEEKQKEIVDSIYYARRIQQSLLPTDKYLSKNLGRSENQRQK